MKELEAREQASGRCRWSPDGRRLAGLLVIGRDGLGVGDRRTYEIASVDATQRVFETPRGELDRPRSGSSDSRRLLIRDRERRYTWSMPRGTSRRILDVTGYYIGCSLGVTRDNRWITYTETATDGDIWLMTLE